MRKKLMKISRKEGVVRPFVRSKDGTKVYLRTPVVFNPYNMGTDAPAYSGNPEEYAFILLYRERNYKRAGPLKYNIFINATQLPVPLENGKSILIASPVPGDFRISFDLNFGTLKDMSKRFKIKDLALGDMHFLEISIAGRILPSTNVHDHGRDSCPLPRGPLALEGPLSGELSPMFPREGSLPLTLGEDKKEVLEPKQRSKTETSLPLKTSHKRSKSIETQMVKTRHDKEIDMEDHQELSSSPAEFPPMHIYPKEGDQVAVGKHLEPLLKGREDIALYNFRDLADAPGCSAEKQEESEGYLHEAKLKEGKIYRSSCVSRSAANKDGVDRILKFIIEEKGINTIIDFRNANEKEDDPHDQYVEQYFPTLKNCSKNLDGKNDCDKRKRFNVALMNTRMKVQGLFWNSSNKSTKLHMAAAAIPTGGNKTIEQTFAEETMNSIGLLGLNKLMLIYGGEEIVSVLKICANKKNYPIMYHCSSGKDRTGLITAMILKICGVPNSDIIKNYADSEVFLSPVAHLIHEENSEKGLIGFDGTPAHVMKETFEFIESHFLSVSSYLNSNGFTYEHQHQLCLSLLDLSSEEKKEFEDAWEKRKAFLRGGGVDSAGIYVKSAQGKKIPLRGFKVVNVSPDKKIDDIEENSVNYFEYLTKFAYILIYRQSCFRKGGLLAFNISINDVPVDVPLIDGKHVLIGIPEPGVFHVKVDIANSAITGFSKKIAVQPDMSCSAFTGHLKLGEMNYFEMAITGHVRLKTELACFGQRDALLSLGLTLLKLNNT
eukprot:CAMPEP_0174263792 /NCGR_PEP_ID=MMETSP0439-20130205/20023_1 /TAXON_ID=0 /ORGANISM="Stereomyxa ramosa, Strain Chinc5" /LENGTH=773 /DNA_ID=CAMNT_0015349341 /DNA_START=15 /DNA_END=2333 /DNA_ORIENTATION=+